MSELSPPAELIPLRDLLNLFTTEGLTVTILARMRAWGFVSSPVVRSLGDAAGTVSLYPAAATVPVIRRYHELQEAARRGEIRRNQNDWLWRMWLEGLPVDMRSWALRRLDDAQKTLDENSADKKPRAGKKPSAVRARIYKDDDRATVLSWALSVARGETPEVGINVVNIQPSILELVLKIGGVAMRLPSPPLLEFGVEDASIARLRDIVARADDADMERSRKDLARFDAALKTFPLDKLPRHARRALAAQHLSITHDTIVFFRALWSEHYTRAIFLAKSIEWTGRHIKLGSFLPTPT